jgi:hypothetical protein
VDKAKAAHDSFAKGVITQFRYDDPFFIADNNIFDIAGAIHEESDLTAEFTGEFDETGSKFVGAEFSNRYPPAIQTFQRLKLA